ncbi:MAG: FoF1 ATP synthase subunit delta/epsilon [Planctomycetota bacterium]|jgi:F0F1-type ATP synthase epsilon subunit
MATSFRCAIVTPGQTLFEGEARYVSFPAWDGQHGVMVGQSPILTALGYGALRVDLAEGGSQWYLLEGGFAQVAGGDLTLLTRNATPADELILQEAQAELATASTRVTEPGAPRKEVDADQQRALAKVTLARAHGK